MVSKSDLSNARTSTTIEIQQGGWPEKDATSCKGEQTVHVYIAQGSPRFSRATISKQMDLGYGPAGSV